MEVTLRIVGLYFNAPVEIEDKGEGVSVKDVLDAYIAKNHISEPGGLSYSVKEDYDTPEKSYSSVLSFTHNYEGRYDFDADGKVNGPFDGASLSGNIREAGLYKLQEGAIPGVVNGVLGWQYYVENQKTGIRKSKTKPERKFDRFDIIPEKPEERIANGDVITWRMVAILLGPSVQGKQPRAYAVAAQAEETSKTYVS